LARRNQIPGFHIGSDWRFNIEAIDHWRFQQQNSRLLAMSAGLRREVVKASSALTDFDERTEF